MKRFLITSAALVSFASLAVLTACDKPAETKTETTTTNASATATPTGTTATTTTTTTTVTVADGDLSTPADFEEAAEKSITAKTYKAELALLEADIAKE